MNLINVVTRHLNSKERRERETTIFRRPDASFNKGGGRRRRVSIQLTRFTQREGPLPPLFVLILWFQAVQQFLSARGKPR